MANQRKIDLGTINVKMKDVPKTGVGYRVDVDFARQTITKSKKTHR